MAELHGEVGAEGGHLVGGELGGEAVGEGAFAVGGFDEVVGGPEGDPGERGRGRSR